MTLIADEVLENRIITVFTAFEQLHPTLRKGVLKGFGIYEEEEALLPMQLLTADTIGSARSYKTEKESALKVAEKLMQMGWCPSVMWEIEDKDIIDREENPLKKMQMQEMHLSKMSSGGDFDKYIISHANEVIDRYAEEWKKIIKDEAKLECATSAICLYKKRRFSAATVLLVPLWEGIINEISPAKTQDQRKKENGKGFKQKYPNPNRIVLELICEIVGNNFFEEYGVLYRKFYGDNIIYGDKAISKGKGNGTDFAMRNSIAHGEIRQGFNEKQALNSIFITNLFVHLKNV